MAETLAADVRCCSYLYWSLCPCRWPVEMLWLPSAIIKNKKTFVVSKSTDSQVSSRLFKRNHTNLISCITFPSPLHDLLEALCRSDTEISELAAGVFLGGSVTFWTLKMSFFFLSHLLPLQTLLLFFLEVFLPLQALALSLLAGFGFGLLPLRKKKTLRWSWQK